MMDNVFYNVFVEYNLTFGVEVENINNRCTRTGKGAGVRWTPLLKEQNKEVQQKGETKCQILKRKTSNRSSKR